MQKSTVWENLPSNLKKTKQRQMILSALQDSPRPLSAPEILEALHKKGETCWLSTIYRNLETMVKTGLVSKSVLIEKNQIYFDLVRVEHNHYAVCSQCHTFLPIEDCPMEPFIQALKKKNFHVNSHSLEVFGLCEACYRQSEENK
ncbi:MAG: transcriptional repressor [Anaerolineaceae bacterium]|nr:transcriptional repressor [Anaerolineaceae bacterium]